MFFQKRLLTIATYARKKGSTSLERQTYGLVEM